jgi:hypothetical protein
MLVPAYAGLPEHVFKVDQNLMIALILEHLYVNLVLELLIINF